MDERGSLRIKAVLLALAAAAVVGAVAAAVLVLSPSGDGASSQLVAVAFRTDGGSPALSVAYGNADDVELDLPAGEYYVDLAYGSDAIFDMGHQTSTGHPMGFGRFWDTTPGKRFTHPEIAAALRTVAGFASDAEAVRLDLLSSASAGFTQPLFSGETTATDFERFYTGYRALGDNEASVTAALKLLDSQLASAEPPRYVRADGAPPAGLLDKLLDSTLPDFFNQMRKLPERERGRVIDIVARMDGTEKQQAFEGLPPNLRGDASTYEEWVQSVERGDLDQQLGAIHGYLYAVATGATQDAGHTPGQSLAEDGGPLLQSGLDLEVKAYGKVPNVGKAVDVTKKALEWEKYARKLYADPNAGAADVLKGPYQAFVKDHIKADLRKAMPDAPEKVIDALAGQLSKRVVSALASGLATPTPGADVSSGRTPGYPPLSAADATDTPEPSGHSGRHGGVDRVRRRHRRATTARRGRARHRRRRRDGRPAAVPAARRHRRAHAPAGAGGVRLHRQRSCRRYRDGGGGGTDDGSAADGAHHSAGRSDRSARADDPARPADRRSATATATGADEGPVRELRPGVRAGSPLGSSRPRRTSSPH